MQVMGLAAYDRAIGSTIISRRFGGFPLDIHLYKYIEDQQMRPPLNELSFPLDHPTGLKGATGFLFHVSQKRNIIL